MQVGKIILGDFMLEGGDMLRQAELCYATWGSLDDARANAVLLPSFITGTHEGYVPFIGDDAAIDSSRWFVVATNLFGNGLSTSPSRASEGQRGPDFPHVTVRDNVRAQARLLDTLRVDRLSLVAGYSLGAQQALQWGVSFPDRVARLLGWCGTARTTAHTKLVFGAMRAALQASPDWRRGRFATPPEIGLRTMAQVYAPWGLSSAWYAREGWKGLGFDTLDAFVAGFWEAAMAGLEANDFLAQAAALIDHDVGAEPRFAGDWRSALSTITARTVLMPGSTDQYFPVAEAEAAVAAIPGACCVPIRSDWGHFAGIGIDPDSTAQIARELRALLSTPDWS